MKIITSQNPDFLSNTYLLIDEVTNTAALIDAGGPLQPLLKILERENLTLSHLLLTHHHYDHVCETAAVLAFAPNVAVFAHPLEGHRLDFPTQECVDGQIVTVGQLRVEALHTPGHTDGMLAFSVDGTQAALFTGDTLFKGSVGGVRAPGHGTYQQLKDSILKRLLTLDPQTVIYPGHSDATTIEREIQENPFVQIWLGADSEGTETCRVFDQKVTLILEVPDYDSGTKAWVRYADGADDIVPGSRLEKY